MASIPKDLWPRVSFEDWSFRVLLILAVLKLAHFNIILCNILFFGSLVLMYLTDYREARKALKKRRIWELCKPSF